MHPQVLSYVGQWATPMAARILDIGGRDVNGTPRALFPEAEWTVVDLHPGPNVDVVGDILDVELPLSHFDFVLCLEVLEHAPRWRQILWAARRWVIPTGRLIVTAAGPGRAPHSGINADGRPREGEWYENIRPLSLADALAAYDWEHVNIVSEGEDVRATAVRPKEYQR